jgi:predicted ATPase/DNA-binding CsgD family transcriptional regulator
LRPLKDRVPAQPWRLIGREHELADLRDLLAEGARLLTLTGAGGTGKTRLALALAESAADEFTSSAFVDLAALRDPSFVPQAIGSALMVPRGPEPPFDSVVRHIGAEPTLLLLDNFEQLLPESAVVSDLLAACPKLVIIATSRAPLELRWERVFHVAPLALPEEASRNFTELRGVASIALFVERARAVKPLFALDKSNAEAACAIVRRLDGLPLAIELAAARLRLLSISELAARVDRALDLLVQSGADRPARQRTIRATIDWSLALLTERQRQLLRRLAIFEAGAMLDGVEEVCGEPGDAAPLLGDVEDLVEAGIVMATEIRGETRVRLPATVRERAIELLHESGEHDVIAGRHVSYVARFCTVAELRIDEAGWYARVETDRENIRAALRHSFGPISGDREQGMAIVYAMGSAWNAQGAVEEAARWTDLALSVGKDSPQWSLVCCESGLVARQAGELARAEHYFRTAREIHRAQELPQRVLYQTEGLGRVARDRGDESAARECYETILRRARELDIQGHWRAGWEVMAAEYLRWFGHADEARAQGERGLLMARELRAEGITATALLTMAELARERGDYHEATSLLDEAWVTVNRIGHRERQRTALTYKIRLACDQHEVAQAAELARQSLQVARDTGDRTVDTAAWIDALAIAAVATAQHAAAARFFAFADNFRAAIGVVVPPVDRPRRERALATVRAALGTRVEQAHDSALSDVFAFANETFHQAPVLSVALSRREREVASLVARGLSNRAIAERLILGERTVETHVERLLRKLELRSRHDVAARAQELALQL